MLSEVRCDVAVGVRKVCVWRALRARHISAPTSGGGARTKGASARAKGGPRTQLSVSIELDPLETSLGTDELLRDQNQTLMNESVRSIAYQPPPALLNDGP